MAEDHCYNEAVKLQLDLKLMYVPAESLMLKSEGARPLEKLINEIDACYDKLIKACEPVPETD